MSDQALRTALEPVLFQLNVLQRQVDRCIDLERFHGTGTLVARVYAQLFERVKAACDEPFLACLAPDPTEVPQDPLDEVAHRRIFSWLAVAIAQLIAFIEVRLGRSGEPPPPVAPPHLGTDEMTRARLRRLLADGGEPEDG